MYELVKTYKQAIPAMRFIGMKYGNKDRVDGSFAAKWGEWHETERFHELDSLVTEDSIHKYEDFDSQIGLMRLKEGEEFEYWIGMFLPEGTEVPEGFESINFSASHLGVCWIQGTQPDIYGKEEECADKLVEEGYELVTDENGAWWFFERYGCPRFTQPDEDGNVILDICHFVK
jgi:predicted transcriptional regulator YdeE